MFLKHIRLKNFRCFEDFEMDFSEGAGNRKHTLILGLNGTGKSNLLKAIGLVTSGSAALGELLGSPESWIKYGKKSCEITATITTAENEKRDLALIIHRGDYLADIIENNKQTLSQIDNALRHTERSYFLLALGASRRLATKSKYKGPENFYETKRANNVATLFNREASLNSLENWAIDLDYRKDKKGLAIIKNSLKSYLPGISFHSINKETRQLIFKTKDGLISLELLSDGYQNMASWLGDLLYRVSTAFPDYKDPMKARGLLLIDEIDLHLHPSWQRQLLDFFKTKLPNFQLIATTHSPLTAQQAGENELYSLVRGKKAIDLVPFRGSPQKMLLNQLLMSPVFGLETDQSVKVEKLKTKYKTLKGEKKRTKKKSQELEVIANELKNLPVQRTNSLLSANDKKLLQEIKQAVVKK